MPKIGEHVLRMPAQAVRHGLMLLAILAGIGRLAMRLIPRRLLRLAEKVEGRRNTRAGHIAAAAFLIAFVIYGLVGGGHLRRMTEATLVATGLSVEEIAIAGHAETAELAILEMLELDTARSLLTFNAAAARDRLKRLPWVEEARVRKIYPDRLEIDVTERIPYALWQHNDAIAVIDHTGATITPYDDPRFAVLPLVVGASANERAEAFLAKLATHPSLSERARASVYVATRRWNLVLQSGITVQLPEENVGEALEQLAVLDAVDGLLSREIKIVDLRLPDRITVRLPDDTAETSKTRSAGELKAMRNKAPTPPGART